MIRFFSLFSLIFIFASYSSANCENILRSNQNLYPISINEALQSETSLIYLGESHLNQSTKTTLISIIPKLKELGFSYLAIEFLNSSDQNLLDQFLDKKVDSEILKTLRKELLQIIEKTWGWYPERYLSVLEAARESDFPVIALDNRSLNTIEDRDEHMASVIAKAFQSQPRKKIVVLVGRLHSARSAQPKTVYDYFGIPSISFEFDRNTDYFYETIIDNLKLRKLND